MTETSDIALQLAQDIQDILPEGTDIVLLRLHYPKEIADGSTDTTPSAHTCCDECRTIRFWDPGCMGYLSPDMRDFARINRTNLDAADIFIMRVGEDSPEAEAKIEELQKEYHNWLQAGKPKPKMASVILNEMPDM